MTEGNIIRYLSTIDGFIGDICAEIYFLFLKENEQAKQNFQLLLENWDEIDSDNSTTVKMAYFPENDYQSCLNGIRPVIGHILSNLVEKNSTSETFHSDLWDTINNVNLFGSDLEKICALLFVVMSPQIPYFQMHDALRMDDDEYRNISQLVERQYKKAVFALNRGYEQRTEVASQIMACLNEINDEKQQIVYMANIIGYFRFVIHQLEEKIKKLNTEVNEEND